MNFDPKLLKIAAMNHAKCLRRDGFQASEPSFWNFDVRLSDTHSLSVAFLPMIRTENSLIETALKCGGSLVYDSGVGYEDVCRFETYDELVEEIRRLQTVKELPIPDEEDEE